MKKKNIQLIYAAIPFILVGVTLMITSVILKYYIGEIEISTSYELEFRHKVYLFASSLLLIGNLINLIGLTFLNIYVILKVSLRRKEKEKPYQDFYRI